MAPTPVEVIQKHGSPELRIRWSDGHESVTALQRVRLACTCAVCNEQRRDAPAWPPPAAELSESVRRPVAAEIRPVGAYALTITWGDGHAHGIYTFQHLRELCECAECVPE